MTKHYRDIDGNYLGGWSMPEVDGSEPDHPDVPEGAIECPVPEDARQKWNGNGWGAKPPDPPDPKEALADALDAAPNDTARWAVLAAYFRT